MSTTAVLIINDDGPRKYVGSFHKDISNITLGSYILKTYDLMLKSGRKNLNNCT